MLEYEVIWGHIDTLFWLLLFEGYLRVGKVEGEYSTSGPQPYQPYEA